MDTEKTAQYVFDTMHLRKNMTVTQRLREATRIWGKGPTGRELAARLKPVYRVNGTARKGKRGV